MKKDSNLEKALYYCKEYEWSIIPVGPNKKPLISWKDYQNKRADEKQIKEWWGKFSNALVGVVTGKISNLVVVDVEKGGSIVGYPKTVKSKTGGGGFHLFFKYPGKFVASRARVRELTDIRGDGGYVILPPSISSKGEYEWELSSEEIEFAELPKWVIQPDEKFEIKEKSSLEDLLYTPAKTGERNDKAARLAGKLISVTPRVLWEIIPVVLKDWNSRNKAPLPEKELLGVYESIKKTELRKNSKSSEFKILQSKELLSMKIEEEPFVINNLIPEKAITGITADSGKGKSLVVMIMAHAISQGKAFLGQDEFKTKKGKVLFVDQEMSTGVIAERYQAIFKGEELPVDYIVDQIWKIEEKPHYEYLRNKIIENKYSVIIFDTLTNIHNKNENDASDIKSINERLLELIRDTGVTIIYLHHHRKPKAGEYHSQSSSRGSTEFMAKLSSHLVIDNRKPDEETVIPGSLPVLNKQVITIEQFKSRRPEKLENKIGIEVIYNKEAKSTSWKYLGVIDDKKKKLDEAKEVVLDLIKDAKDEQTVADLKGKVLCGLSVLRKALSELVNDKIINVRNGEGSYHQTKYYSLVEDEMQKELEIPEIAY